MNEQTPVKGKGLAPVFRMAVLAGIKASVQLHVLAASRGHAEICRLLLEAGADPAHVDVEGNDALMAATAKGHQAVAEIIRSASTSPAAPEPVPPQPVEAGRPSLVEETGEACLGDLPAQPPADAGAGTAPTTTQPDRFDADPDPKADEGSRSDVSGTPFRDQDDGTCVEVASASEVPPLSQDADGLDLSGWEEETDSPPPPADPTCAAGADELQRRLSLHVPIDIDAGWDDVDIDLPDILVSVRRRVKLDGDEETALKELVMAAIADGRVRGERLALVALRDQDDPDRPDADYVANLRTMLGDMGVVVDDDPATPDRPSEPDDEDDALRDEAAEGMAFLRILNSNRADPLTHYIGGLPRDRLTRDDEASLAMQIERGTKDALAAVAMSPAAVSELLAAVDSVIGGLTPLEAVLDSDDEGEEEDEEAGVEEGAVPTEEAQGMPDARSLPPEMLFRLEAIRDLCQRLAKGRDVGFAERLGDRLAALGLSHAFVSRLHRAVEARRLMEAGIERARRAKERFALANLKLVVWGAKKFGGLTWPDRIQEGNLGLLKAVERFDHRRGAKFSTYATWWITQAVTRAVADKGRTIRVPVHAHEAIRKVRRVQSQIHSLTGREAEADEIAELTEIPPARVRRFLAVADEPVSRSPSSVSSETAELASPEPDPEKRLAVAEVSTLVRRQLETLSPKEATILRLRFGIGCDKEHTLEEVGQQFGVTRERIRQIEAKALKKLSHPGRIKALQGCR
jgi:RNA polymerase primary sigma factor